MQKLHLSYFCETLLPQHFPSAFVLGRSLGGSKPAVSPVQGYLVKKVYN